MLKIITLVLLLASGNVFAEQSPWANKPNTVKPVTYTECVEGQIVFVVASQYGVAAIQMFKDTADMVPKPIECGDEDET